MYEKCKIYLDAVKSQITVKRFIMLAGALLLVIGACQLIDGYLTARGNYQRAVERLEQTQNELNRSRRLNQELKLVIERSSELNSQAGDRIARIEDYQRRTGEGISRAQEYQRSTGARIGESLKHNRRAREELKSSLELIRRIEERNQKQ